MLLRKIVMTLPNLFDLEINNFTSIDIALDCRLNIPSMIKKLMRNRELYTIINGKKVDNRKGILNGVCFEYSTSLDRLNSPSITIKQKKAIKNKNDGIIVQAYDKRNEIEKNSEKHYILDYHGNPKRLFRLEVRLRYQELKDYLNKLGLVPQIEIILNNKLLEDMFFYHLSSVIRFTKGRKKLDWRTLIKCNGRG